MKMLDIFNSKNKDAKLVSETYSKLCQTSLMKLSWSWSTWTYKKKCDDKLDKEDKKNYLFDTCIEKLVHCSLF